MDEYIRLYGRRLYGLCRTLCARPQDAEDLYQDTWLKAMQHFGRYDPGRPFEPWLTAICVNTYRNRLRRLLRSPVYDGFATPEAKTAALENAPARERDSNLPLRQAVEELPEKLRITVVLFFFQDMDTAAVAKTLSIPPGTVKSRLHKARKLLREALYDETDI